MNKLFMAVSNLFRGKKRLFNIFLIVLLVMIIAALPFIVYAGRVYYIKVVGLELVPSKDYPVDIKEYYRQKDPLWKDDKIGYTQRRMENTGCLICCVSTAISYLNVPITPKELNSKLTENNGYQGADLIWYKINEILPEVDYRYSRIFDSKTIEKDLDRGLLPVVNVRYYKTGVTHWVLIVGAKDGEFLICDPMGDGHSTMLLSEHGKVLAYRVIEKSGNN